VRRVDDLWIVGWSFRGPLLVLAVLAIVAAAISIVRHRRRGVFIPIAVVLVLLNLAAGVNTYFGYFPRLGGLYGVPAYDAEPRSALDRDDVPDRGVVVEMAIPGTRSGFDARDAVVYVPPAWFERPRPTLPVLMLLHGSPGFPSDWTRAASADLMADAWAAEHEGVAPILVLPDANGSLLADSECLDGEHGNIETYLSEDVPAFVAERFGASDDPARWAIGGASMGGMCAVMLALRHPDRFRTFVDVSGFVGPRSGGSNRVGDTVQELFGGDRAAFEAHEPLTLLERGDYPDTGGWFATGSDDAVPIVAIDHLAPAARAAGIETCVDETPGDHTFVTFGALLARAFPWVMMRLGLAPDAGSAATACGDAAS
jgi:S-formylglutathione hydrolase FrmB